MRLLCAMLLLSLAACSSQPKQDEELGPKALTAFDEEIELDVVWHKQIGKGLGKAYANMIPSINNGQVFAADAHGLVQTIDLKSGGLVWQSDLAIELTAGVAVAKNHVYVASANGHLIALDKENGSQVWSVDVASEVLSLPSVTDDYIAVQTIDGKLHLLNHDGKPQWNFDSNLPSLSVRGTSSPVFHNDSVLAGFANGKIVSLALADGTLQWSERIGVPAGRSELERLVDVDGRLLVRDETLFVSGYQGHLAAIDLRSGKMMWKREASSYHGPLYGLGNLYLVGADDQVVAYDERSGNHVWIQAGLEGRQLSESVFFKNHIAFADFEGYIHLVKQLDGTLVGRESISRPATDWVRTGSYGLQHPSRYFSLDKGIRTRLVVKDHYLLALNNSGFLTLLELDQ